MCREAEGRPCSEVVNSRVEDGCVLTREGEVLRADLRVRAGEGEHALGQHPRQVRSPGLTNRAHSLFGECGGVFVPLIFTR